MDEFDELKFKHHVSEALQYVKKLLDHHRTLSHPSSVDHTYEDKYLLAEHLTHITIASHHNSLVLLGVRGEVLKQLREWAQKRSVTVRLKCEHACEYLREVSREVQSPTKVVSKSVVGTSESYTVTKVTEHFWAYKVSWELSAFAGVDYDDRIALQSRTITVELKTPDKHAPKKLPQKLPHDVNITWLLQNMDDSGIPTFRINKASNDCKTPRRNSEVDDCLTFLRSFYNWAEHLHSFITGETFKEPTDSHLQSIADDGVFVPALPVFEKPHDPTLSTSSPKIPPIVMSTFLAEETRSLDSKFKDLSKTFADDARLLSFAEAKLCVVLLHILHVNTAYSQGVDSIENMLENQVVAAIGKQVTPADFSNYLTYHNRKLFKEQFRPQQFCYAIRRPGYHPEGTLSIESDSTPITTVASYKFATRPMKFPINASTQVSFFGDRYLHGYITHKFGSFSTNKLSLCARTKQFSSFILLVGRIVSADIFDPKHAIIIQNKDELKIPLMLETIPTPKAFKDAIASLSPEQQQFCKAFRGMQLESTLFGVCVIQIKPQLEKLLNLPEDSLTKEIQLTQDLLKLFITYQIPSDLLSYDGPETDSPSAQISQVKEYAKRMQSVFDKEKQAELDEAERQRQMRFAELQAPKRETSSKATEFHPSDRLVRAMLVAQESQSLGSDVLVRLEEQRQIMMNTSTNLSEVHRSVSDNIEALLERGDSLSIREANCELLHANSSQISATASIKSSITTLFKKSDKPASNSKGAPAPTAKPTSVGGRAPTSQSILQQAMDAQSQSLQQLQAQATTITAPQSTSTTTATTTQTATKASKRSNKPPEHSKTKKQEHQTKAQFKQTEEASMDESSVVDYTKIPTELERKFESVDTSNALRPTIINPGSEWKMAFQKSLLSKAEKKTLKAESQDKERDKAFDLLDALTKSGALSIDHASLHVVVASTHCFEKSLMQTIVQDNINPIEKIENSSIIVAATIHHTHPTELISPQHLEHISTTAPLLLEMPHE